MAVSLCILLSSAGKAPDAVAQSTAAGTRLQRAIPAGFETLAAARHLQVAVLFDKVQVGTAGATVDLEAIVFDDPAAVAALVPNIADRPDLAAALAGPLSLNAGLVCNELAQAGCGRLTPDVAGVIYDSAGEAVQLFVNPGLRRWAASLERLQPRDSEPALLGRMNLSFSGQAGNEPLYSLALNTVGGLGATHIRTQALVRNARSDVDQLYARHVDNGFERVAGLFSASASSLLPPVRLLGARFGTTLDDLPAEAGAYDVPLIIALASPATIDAFVGERLIASARHQAGDARLDTSGFPAGAYLVRLRIIEAGQERIEERFFARATAFPPLGAPQTSLAFGLRYPAFGFELAGAQADTAAVQLSHRRRLSQRFGLGGSLYARGDAVAAEAELGLSASGMQWSASMLATTTGEFTGATSVRAQAGAWRWFADARRVAAASDSSFEEERFLGVRDSFWQASMGVTRSFGRAHLQATGLWRRSAAGSESWSVQPLLDLPLEISGRRIGLRISGDFGSDHRTVRFEFGLPTSKRSITARVGARLQQQSGATQVSPIYETEIADQWRVARATEIQGNLKWRQDERESVTASAQLRSDRGSAFLSLQSDLDSERETYFGNAQSGFAWTRAGVALTTPSAGEAAVVYVNNSQVRNGAADALLSNARIGTLDPQQTRVQPVPAFRKAAVGMLPARGASLSGGSRNRETTLFPGTVAVVATQFVHVAAAFGQLLELEGTPIAGAILAGSHGDGATDANGYFQLDVAAEEQISVRRSDGTTCRFRLAVPSADAAIFDAGRIQCP
jgi:hypothetical protein